MKIINSDVPNLIYQLHNFEPENDKLKILILAFFQNLTSFDHNDSEIKCLKF